MEDICVDYCESTNCENCKYENSSKEDREKAYRGEINMFSADEARKRTNEIVYNNSIKELKQVEDKINNAIESGAYSIAEAGHLSIDVVCKLIELGYKVENNSNYCESYYYYITRNNVPYSCISWE